MSLGTEWVVQSHKHLQAPYPYILTLRQTPSLMDLKDLTGSLTAALISSL